MRRLIGLLALAALMSACAPGTTFPLLIPTPVPPDEDCTNFNDRNRDVLQMDELFMSIVDDRVTFDEEAAREHGFSEKSITLARELATLSDAWLHTRPGDDPPEVTAHVQWLYDCATEYHKQKN